MEEKKIPDIPYIAHEEEVARMERNVKRWFIGWIITFLALVLTNIGWIVYENQYQDVYSESYSAESGEGGTAIANGYGEVTVNGESELQESQD